METEKYIDENRLAERVYVFQNFFLNSTAILKNKKIFQKDFKLNKDFMLVLGEISSSSKVQQLIIRNFEGGENSELHISHKMKIFDRENQAPEKINEKKRLLKRRTSIKQIQKGTKNLSCYDQAADGLKCIRKFYNMRTELYIIYKQLHDAITENIFRKNLLIENTKKVQNINNNIVINTSNVCPINSHSNKVKKKLANNRNNLKLLCLTKELNGDDPLITYQDYNLPSIKDEKDWKLDKYRSKKSKFQDSILFKFFVPLEDQKKIKDISEKYLNSHRFLIDDNSIQRKKMKTERKSQKFIHKNKADVSSRLDLINKYLGETKQSIEQYGKLKNLNIKLEV